MSLVLDGSSGITTNSGTLISASTIGVGGTTPSASGAGISFPATQSASTDVNTLDDYEEGTFTANLAFNSGQTGSFTFTQNTGYYIKVGRLVHWQAWVTWTAKPSAGSTLKVALPFTSVSGNSYRGGFCIGYVDPSTFSITSYQLALRMESSANNAIFNYTSTTGASINTEIGQASVGTSGSVMMSGTFVCDQ